MVWLVGFVVVFVCSVFFKDKESSSISERRSLNSRSSVFQSTLSSGVGIAFQALE